MSKLQHLRYDMIGAPPEHAQQVMRNLGITYVHATPQSIGDCWWFWGCSNVPDPMPEYLEPLQIDDPLSYVGWGLNKEAAQKIADAMEKDAKE